MRRQRVNPLYSGVAAAILLAVVMTAVFVSGVPGGPQIQLPWSQRMTLNVQLADADALAPHASVEMAGVKVGEVQSVTADGKVAVAALQIDPQYFDIHSDATVYLRPHGLFGPKYIDIVPGTADAPSVHDGGTLAVDQSVQPVDLNAILQDLQAPEQQNLRTTIVELGQAAAGQGSDVNHLLAAADSLSQVLDSPLRAADAVSPNLSDMLVNNDSFNQAFAQTPLDQLVANDETTFSAFAGNANHIESVLVHADSALTTLDTALGGQSENIKTVIQTIAEPSPNANSPSLTTRLQSFTYLLGLFGANLTGRESRSSDPSDLNVVGGIIGAIQNVASAFHYSQPCQKTPAKPDPSNAATNTNHCWWSNNYFDGSQHFLHVRVNNFPPGSGATLPQVCIPNPAPPPSQICVPFASAQVAAGTPLETGLSLDGLSALLAS